MLKKITCSKQYAFGLNLPPALNSSEIHHLLGWTPTNKRRLKDSHVIDNFNKMDKAFH
jgi:hypothetical protein